MHPKYGNAGKSDAIAGVGGRTQVEEGVEGATGAVFIARRRVPIEA